PQHRGPPDGRRPAGRARVLRLRAGGRARARAVPRPAGAPGVSAGVARLNWGCGPHAAPGRTNSDARPGPGVALCRDIRDGLALPSDALDDRERESPSVEAVK